EPARAPRRPGHGMALGRKVKKWVCHAAQTIHGASIHRWIAIRHTMPHSQASRVGPRCHLRFIPGSTRYGNIDAIAAPNARLWLSRLAINHCLGPNPGTAGDPIHQGRRTSALMDANADFDPLFGQPRMNAVPVSITPINGSTGAH